MSTPFRPGPGPNPNYGPSYYGNPNAGGSEGRPTMVQQPPKKKSGWWKSKPAIGVAAFLVGIMFGNAGGGSPASSTSAPAPAATMTVTAPAEAAPTVTMTAPAKAAPTVTVTAPAAATTVAAKAESKTSAITDGTYLVGSEIPPGTYKSDGGGSTLCYADTQDKAGNILQQEVAGGGEAVVIRIASSAYTFKSSDCGSWKKVG